MAIQFIKQPPGLGALLGQGLGAGLGTGLQQALGQQQKFQEQERGISALQQGFGMSPEYARAFQQAHPGVQQQLIRQQQAKQQKESELAQGVRAYMTMGLPFDQAYAVASSPQSVQKEFLKGMSRLGMNTQPGAFGQAPQPPKEVQEGRVTPQQAAAQEGADLTPKNKFEELQQGIREAAEGALAQKVKKPDTLLDVLGAPSIEEQRLEQQKREAEAKYRILPLTQEMNLLYKRVKDRDQLNKNLLEEQSKILTTSDTQIKRLRDMDQLARKGDLNSGAYLTFIDNVLPMFGIGGDLTYLKSLDTAALEKEAAQFAEMAKEFFGARVTDFDLKTLFKMIPNAKMTRDQQLLVSAGLQTVLKAKRAVAKEMMKITKDYDEKGKPLPRPNELMGMAKKNAKDKIAEYDDQLKRTSEKIRKGDFTLTPKRKKFGSIQDALQKANVGDVLIINGKRQRVGPNKELIAIEET